MGADFSRVRLNPLLDYAGVELKQGGVLLDADANELVGDRRPAPARAGERRARAAPRSHRPRPTPSGSPSSAARCSIGKGRLYVDGLLAENHGAASTDPAKRVFDPLLAEAQFRRSDPLRRAALSAQSAGAADGRPPPRLPRRLGPRGHASRAARPGRERGRRRDQLAPADRLAGAGARRRMPALARPARRRTPTCPAGATIIAPSTGVLTTGTFDVAPVDDPCELPPTGGYPRAREPALPRRDPRSRPARRRRHLQVVARERQRRQPRREHDLGQRARARDAGPRRRAALQHRRLGRDHRRRARVLASARRDARASPSIEATRRIHFTPALPAAMLPGSFPDSAFPGDRNLRVRRWDQKGEVFRTDAGGTPVQVQDLDAAGSTGRHRRSRRGTTLLLENGVTVSFASTGAKGFRAGDYWVFAARTADASVEILDRAPPRGIHHHYARLGIWDVAARASSPTAATTGRHAATAAAAASASGRGKAFKPQSTICRRKVAASA